MSLKGVKKIYFPRVKEARDVLRDKAVEILDMYITTIKLAQEAGDYEVAASSLQYLMDHMPEDEGIRMVDVSIDKPKQIEGKEPARISIGIALGGIQTPKSLPVVSVEPADE